MFELSGKRVWVAGHTGMVGSALLRRLKREKPERILTVDRADLDLKNQDATFQWLMMNKPDVVFVAAAKVGGILANKSFPADFLYENLALTCNIIEGSRLAGVNKLLFLGSSCIYPKFAEQPIQEHSLLDGKLEATNEPYALAKIAGLKLCETYSHQFGCNFISAMPTNLYGPGDNYHPEHSHVLPALIRKAHRAKLNNAKSLEIWGSGVPRREFLHVDDCADALVHLMKYHDGPGHVNVGYGEDISIESLAHLVMEVVGFSGELAKDGTKPDGTPRKLMSSKKLRSLGWEPSIPLRDGIAEAYEWYLRNEAEIGRHITI